MSKSFKAVIEGQGPGDAWARVFIPFDVEKAFGSRARVSVRGTINGFPFRTSIFPTGDGTHQMMVNKTMKQGAKAKTGERVNVTLDIDDAPREVEIPTDLTKALKSSATARKLFDALSPSCKKEYVEWICSAKRDETRRTRVEKAVTMLADGKKRVKG